MAKNAFVVAVLLTFAVSAHQANRFAEVSPASPSTHSLITPKTSWLSDFILRHCSNCAGWLS